MIGLIAWCRDFDAEGNRIALPAGLSRFLWSHARDTAAIFDLVQLPPLSLAQGGTGAGCDGYEVFEYRNFDGTRWGSKQDAMCAVAALRAHGARVALDFSAHQMGGENGGPGVFTYDGRRGATVPGWFQGGYGTDDPIPPFAKQDSIPSADGAYPFGRPRAYENSVPAGVVEADTRDVLNITRRIFDVDLARWDDVKATHAPSVKRLMDSQPDLPFYAEYFDGNPANLNAWAMGKTMQGRAAVEDFTLHWALQGACNGFDARLLDDSSFGYWQWNSGLSVGFVDNSDTDTSPGQQVVFNKGIAYALMLNLPLRAALVYAKDYYPSSILPGGYGLWRLIDNLSWIARTFAFGNFVRRWVDQDVYAYTRDGNGGAVGWSGGLLVACNFNTLSARTITVDTHWGAGQRLHDYTGHEPDVWVVDSGKVTITLPSNAYSAGQSYVCYATAGVDQPFTNAPRSTTQTFFGANDLLIKAAKNGSQAMPEKLYIAKDSSVNVRIVADLPAGATLVGSVVAFGGKEVAIDRIGSGPANFPGGTTTEGWCSVLLEGFGLPAEGVPFELSVTYMGA